GVGGDPDFKALTKRVVRNVVDGLAEAAWRGGSRQRPSPSQHACQVLRRVRRFTQYSDMETKRDLVTRVSHLPLHPQDEVECRRCGVHCDKVVHPSACVERDWAFLYSYQEFGHTTVGCMQKVFDVEIDLALLRAAEATGEFGAVKATHKPLPMCRAEVESCYDSRTEDVGCLNPEFYELPVGEP